MAERKGRRPETVSSRKSYNANRITEFKAEKAKWEARVLNKSLEKRPELKESFKSGSGEIVVNRLYTPADTIDINYLKDIGFPGQYPFTRGIYPSGYRAHVEPMSYYSGFGSSEDANERYKALIAKGGNEVFLALDLPTQLGLDSDHPMAEGEVGKIGIAVDSLEDMERLFEGIPLDKISTGTVGNSIGPIALALFIALGEKKGVSPEMMQVTLQNDPLKEYTGRGTFIFPVSTAVDLAADVVDFCFRNLPRWTPQFACATQMRWGGCSAAQEIAFGIANLITYIEAALERGIGLVKIVPKMNLHATADNDLFEEAAKFRAMRRLWAKIASERFQTQDQRVLALKITNWIGSHRLTAQQPLNNIVRSTLHVLACLLGGVENIMTPAFDEALALPTVESTRLGSLTKQIILYEGGLTNTVDPLGGSYYVESLTNQLEKKAKKYFDKVNTMGGAIAAVEKGYYLKEMADRMYEYQREVEREERTVVGVNKYQLHDEKISIDIFTGNLKGEKRQLERLKELKKKRDTYLVRESLKEVRLAAQKKARKNDANIVPSIIKAVGSYATIGEICDELRSVFGEYESINVF